MHKAVHNYHEYLASPQSWMIGRLIIPLDRLEEFRRECQGLAVAPTRRRWRISCLWSADSLASGSTITAAWQRMQDFNRGTREEDAVELLIDTVEAPCNNEQDIRRLAASLPGQWRVFVEIPLYPLSERCLDLLREGPMLAAKVRTGGVTPEAIPSADHLAEFLHAATVRQLPFKCTAGLHHPLPARRPLTYQPESPLGTMHGFWNVLFATGLLMSGAIDRQSVRELLQDQQSTSFQFGRDHLAWRSFRLSLAEAEQLRRHGFVSFGSCSFCEPVEDLRQLGWLPHTEEFTWGR
jgi:hypothetical protein